MTEIVDEIIEKVVQAGGFTPNKETYKRKIKNGVERGGEPGSFDRREEHEGVNFDFEPGGLREDGTRDSDEPIDIDEDEEARCNRIFGTTNAPACRKLKDVKVFTSSEIEKSIVDICKGDPSTVADMMKTATGKELYQKIYTKYLGENPDPYRC